MFSALKLVYLVLCFYFGTIQGCQPPTVMNTMSTTMMPSSNSKMSSKASEKPENTNSHDDVKTLVARKSKSSYSDDCQMAKISVVTNKLYSDESVKMNFERINQELFLLETFTQTKLSFFGNYTSQPVKFNKFFTTKFVFPSASKAAKNCGSLKDFTNKAVSLSESIEKAYFICGCESPIEISKVHSRFF
ncbi:hypothetical protein L596_011369 [Steinernema carpocapsae]|uniref:Uncharacterized protein n=1 Tax=Steinernema carpocapsae TaxID=34508 RepID=A0A4U5NU68_STECR|nr:hypothetical protein L596_011369 [Steinernema carpocapsae]